MKTNRTGMRVFLLSLFATLLPLWASAQVEIDGIWYNLVSKAKTAEVTSNPDGNTKYSGDIAIPATMSHGGMRYSVTSIEEGAFDGCSSLTSITIPESVTSIGNRSFDKCTSLKEVIIEDGSETLTLGFSSHNSLGRGDGLFIYCPLESVYVGRNLSYENGLSHGYSPFYKNTREATITLGDHITTISSYLFFGCKSLTSINIPENVTIIGNHAFDNCENLTSINIPKNVRDIEYNAFSGCSSLTSITIPESVTSIGSYAFSDCSSLTSITIPESVTSIVKGIFFGCSSLTSINIPASVTSIDSHVFYECESLISIHIPESVPSIGSYAFYGCSSLTSFTIPGVTSIGHNAFYGCSSLTAITIPESVTSIGYNAFDNCTTLKKVIFEDGCETLNLGYYTNNIRGLFYNCPLESVYLGRNLSYKEGDSPFCDIKTLTSVVIGEGVTSIGNWAFGDCENLASINIPASVMSIGEWAFSDCSNLTYIAIPEGVTNIAEGTFYGCYSLTSVVIPDGVTSIGSYAFSGCSVLTSITIPNSVKSIGSSAFAYCYGLTSITIPKGVTSIEKNTFNDCFDLISITLPEGIASIGKCAFNECGSLTSITIPNSVTSIEEEAFRSCSSLTAITIPESVKSIGQEAFAGCAFLQDVYCYAEKVPTTESDAFDGSYPADVTLHVPANALEAYKTTAPWSSFGTIVAIEGEQPDEPTEEGWSEWEALGTAVTISGKEAMMTTLQSWGEGTIASWEEPITIDQRYDRADPTKKQLRLSDIFNGKDIILDYDSSTATISAEKQGTGYGTNKDKMESQGVANPYDEFMFALSTGTYRPATGVINMSNAFFYANERLGFRLGFTLQIEGVTPPTFTGQWDRKYVGREGGEATFTLTFEEPIVKYRALVFAPGESYSSSAIKELYVANPVTELNYLESDNPAITITCDKIGVYHVVIVPIGADGTAVMDYGSTQINSYAEPEYDSYTWEYIGESTVIEHVGSMLITKDDIRVEVDGNWVNKYPWQATVEGVKTYRRADNPNIIGLCNLYGENHPYSSLFTYIDQTQDWWVYLDVTDPANVKMLTTPVGALVVNNGYNSFIQQSSYAEAATCADGVITFPYFSVVIGNLVNQDMEATFDFKVILPEEKEPAEGWSEWEALGTAVTISGKEAMMTSLQYWGEGEIAPWEEPITIDQRYDRADPTKKQLRLNGIFNAKEIVLDYDSSTGKISAEQQSTGYATNKTMIEGQGVSNPYDEFIFSLSTGTYRSATGVINMSNAFFYINELLGLSMGFTLQIEGVTPPTFTGQWDRKYVGREGGEATFTLTFEEPIVKYRALVLAPGESLTVSAVSALYAANPETDLKYVETDQTTITITCDKMGTYRVVFVPIGADGTAVLDYKVVSIVSYAEPAYETYEWEYIGESTVSEHVGSLLISNEELWEEGEDGLINRYPFMTTSEGVKTYRRADNPNIIGLCNLYGENHPYSSMFTYVDQTQDWWVYIDVTDPENVKLLTTPVGAVSSQVGYATFITQYTDAGEATLSDGVVIFPRGSVLLNNILNQDFQADFDFKVILPKEEEPGKVVNQIELNQTSTTLIEGETMTLTATVTPDDADDTSVTWSSSDVAVATVDAQGKVTAVGSGFAIITATANDGSGVSASCDVTVLGIYSITYMLDGVVYYYDELTQGAKIVLPKEPVKEGYTFSGWGEVPETMPAEDVVVEGTFVVNKYLVTFRIGDEVVAADSLEYGAVIVVPDAPAKEGYTFSGWGEVPETMPAEDVIVEGTYTVNVYKVYYYVGEELVHTAEVAYGEVIPEYIYEPTAEGDVFMGWIGETYETMPAHDVTYTANIESGIHHSILNSHDTVIYDLSGRRVLNVENLTGIYIINGKKVLLK